MKRLILFLIYIAFIGCKYPGTETGNPDLKNPDNANREEPINTSPLNSISLNLAVTICKKINNCYSDSLIDSCITASLKNSHFAEALNLPENRFPNLEKIIEAELKKELDTWDVGNRECLADINNLTCDHYLLKDQWQNQSPKEFLNTYRLLFATPFCQRIFTVK